MKQNLQYKILCTVMAIGAVALTTASPALAADVVEKDGDLYANGNRVTIGGDKSDFPGPYFAVVGAGDLLINESDTTDATGSDITIIGGTHTQVYGGSTWDMSAYNNKVTINNNTIIKSSDDIIPALVAGGYSDSGDVYSNSVYLNDNVKIDGNVYGGQVIYDGSVFNNYVEINNNVNVTGSVYGGNSGQGSANNNYVYIKGENTTSINSVFGGYSNYGSVNNNKIDIINATVNDIVVGGNTFRESFFPELNPSTGTANNNTVNLTNATIKGAVFGGLAEEGESSGNTVNVYNSLISKDIVGGFSSEGSADYNYVDIKDATIDGAVYGGTSGASSANYNTIHINDIKSTQPLNITGAAGTSANYNKVIIDSITMPENVTTENSIFGANATNTASYNDVIINGGTFKNSGISAASANKAYSNNVIISDGEFNDTYIFAASADTAENNNVIISGGTFKNTNIYAAQAFNGTANNNSITITGNANGKNADLTDANLYGYRGGATDTGNSLNIDGWSGDVERVNQFNSLNFTNIDWNRDSNTPILNIKGISNLSKTSIDEISFTGGGHIRPGDEYTLITDNSGAVAGYNINPANVTGNYIAGIALEGDGAATAIKTTENGKNIFNLVYTVKSVRTSKQADLVTQSRAVSAAFINQGTDLISDSLDTLSRDGNYGVKTFAAVHGNRSKYDVNSDLKINGWSTIVGVGNAAEFTDGDEFSWGVFYENGSGNYRTYNEFNNEFFRGDGSLVYNGGGIAARYENNSGVYTEGSLRAGMLKNEMDNVLQDTNHVGHGYKTESAYYGAHIGVGKIISLSESSDLDVYGKFFHTYTEGDSFTVASDKFELDSITSDRLRIGARITTNKANAFSTYYGLAYEYEFNGDADMTAQNLKAPTQSLQGSSYMAEVGFNYQPTPDSPWSFDLNMRGYAGEREGASFNVQATYTF